jgi:hypothetical protein
MARPLGFAFATAFVLGLGLGAGVLACAHARHTAVVVDVALYESLASLHAAEQTALCGLPSCAGSTQEQFVRGWTLAKSQAFNAKLLPAVEGGRQFNRMLSEWQPGTPMPAGLSPIIVSLSASLTAVTEDFPDGTTKTAVLANIGAAQAMILNALSLALGGWK